MRSKQLLCAAALLAVGYVTPVLALDLPAGVKQVETEDYGDILVDQKGMSLYWFSKDDDNHSTCYGTCEEQWPILEAGVGEAPVGEFDLLKRDDGRVQWSYQGRPLYFWEKDYAPGDVTGHGFKREWYVAKPDGSKAPIKRKKKRSSGY